MPIPYIIVLNMMKIAVVATRPRRLPKFRSCSGGSDFSRERWRLLSSKVKKVALEVVQSKNFIPCAGLCVAAAALCLNAAGLHPVMKMMREDAAYRIAPKIRDSVADTSTFDATQKLGKFVDRRELSSGIKEILNRKAVTGGYTIVYGAKGVGKSTIVDSVIQGRPGVIKIKVTSNTSQTEIISKLAEITGTTGLNPTVDDFLKAMRMSVSGGGTVPTIVFEIELGISAEQKDGIHGIRSLAKELSTGCSVILILSEANAALEFGSDEHREEFIFVGELNELEAREFLTNTPELKLSDSHIEHVLDNIGANPAALADMGTKMARDGISVQDFVALKLKRATANLVAFQHQQILKALKEHPEGVSAAHFNKLESEGVDLSNPRAVAVAMKSSNALTYRIELDKYVMLSRSHEVALRTYEPILPRW